MRYFLALFLLLCVFLANKASAFEPKHCLEETDCSEQISSPLPAQFALFSTFWEIGPQPAAHCGNKLFINYDPTRVSFAFADTNAPTGQDTLNFEIGPAFAGGDCANCTEGISFTWLDWFNDATLLPAGPDTELEITWQYLSATSEGILFEGIAGEGFEFLPGCTLTDTDTLNDLVFVPEPGVASMLMAGVLGLAFAVRRNR